MNRVICQMATEKGKKNLHRRSRRERRKTGGKGEEREGKPHKLKSERNHVPRQRDKTTEDLENSGKTLGDLMDSVKPRWSKQRVQGQAWHSLGLCHKDQRVGSMDQWEAEGAREMVENGFKILQVHLSFFVEN